MPERGRINLGLRILLLVLVAALPVLGLQVYDEVQTRKSREEAFTSATEQSARLLAAQFSAFVDGVRIFAATLSRLPAMQEQDPEVCLEAIQLYAAQFTSLTQILVTDENGVVYCNGLNPGTTIDLSDRQYVMESIRDQRFTTSGFILGRQTHDPRLSFAYPVLGAAGEARGAVIVSYDVRNISSELAAGRPTSGQVLLLVDENLVRIARIPLDPSLIGQPLERGGLREAISSGGAGSLLTEGPDGLRLDAYAPVAGRSGLHAIVSAPLDAFEAADRQFRWSLLGVLAVFLVAGVAALAIGHVTIRLPILHLTRLTEAMARGELGVRAGRMRGSPPEHKQLARSFNRMADALEGSTRQLRDSEARFRLALGGSPIFVFECDRDLRLTWGFNPPPPLDMERLEGKAIPEIGGGEAAKYRQLYRQIVGTRRGIRDEFVHVIAGRRRIFDLTLEPRLDGSGNITGLSGVAVDITDRKRTEEQLRLLAAEIDHRAKNILAVVLSIVRQSAVNAGSVQEFLSSIDGRVAAMARAHSLLGETRWQSVDLRRLIEEELAPYRRGAEGNVAISGPDCMLTPKAGLALGLALHELATNAVKYGGLSRESGSVTVTWRFAPAAEEGALVLDWAEQGGPEAPRVRRNGFGTKLIERSLAMDLGGSTEHAIAAGGARCRMRLPAEHVMKSAEKETVEESMLTGGQDKAAGLAGVRVLVVEDTALILMEVESAIEDAGGTVVGPATRVGQAARLAESEEFDVALLDVNLDGELTYPVADVLARREKPFVLATGYDPQTSIVAEYRDRPVLRKPYTGDGLVRVLKDLVQ